MYCRRMTTAVQQAIAASIAFELTRADRSKRWLSEQTGIPYSTLDRKMRARGDFTFTDLAKIAAALGVSPSAFTPPVFLPAEKVSA